MLYTDASQLGLGAILSQHDDNGDERVVQYLSRRLDGHEQNYSATEKECLAVVWAIEKCRPYLYARRFKVVTDCAALKWLMETRVPSGRLTRWSLRLSEYVFDIHYRKGSANANADALSHAMTGIPIPARYPHADPTTVAHTATYSAWSLLDACLVSAGSAAATGGGVPAPATESSVQPRASTVTPSPPQPRGKRKRKVVLLAGQKAKRDMEFERSEQEADVAFSDSLTIPSPKISSLLATAPTTAASGEASAMDCVSDVDSAMATDPCQTTQDACASVPAPTSPESSTSVESTQDGEAAADPDPYPDSTDVMAAEEEFDELDTTLQPQEVDLSLLEAQKVDDFCRDLRQAVTSKKVPDKRDGEPPYMAFIRANVKDFCFNDRGQLVKRHLTIGQTLYCNLLVVPPSMRVQIIYFYHASKMGGHTHGLREDLPQDPAERLLVARYLLGCPGLARQLHHLQSTSSQSIWCQDWYYQAVGGD